MTEDLKSRYDDSVFLCKSQHGLRYWKKFSHEWRWSEDRESLRLFSNFERISLLLCVQNPAGEKKARFDDS